MILCACSCVPLVIWIVLLLWCGLSLHAAGGRVLCAGMCRACLAAAHLLTQAGGGASNPAGPLAASGANMTALHGLSGIKVRAGI